MRIERINENSISCTLTSFDLSVRNLNIRELAYGSDKARQLFSEMMTKASSEVGFNADNTPIMIEAIPMGSNSIKLIISKVSDPEELDARFSRFTEQPGGPLAKSDPSGFLSKLTQALLEGAGGVSGFFEKSAAEDSAPETPADDTPGESTLRAPDYRAFCFEDLDDLIRACGDARGSLVMTRLFKRPSDGSYVLVVGEMVPESDDFARACNIIAEYGRMIKTAPHSVSYYEEHYTLVAADDVLMKLGSL